VFKHRYLPITEQDREEMLKTIGADSVDDLFADVPRSTESESSNESSIPPALSEYELTKHMKKLAGKNATAETHSMFLGAGVYDHIIPAVVNHTILKQEFYSAYVPYQPEVSQGELQALFEFQTMIAELTGMDIANSSLYDGFAALGEAGNLAVGKTKKSKVLASGALHPQARETLNTYGYSSGYDVHSVDVDHDITDLDDLREKVDDDLAAVVIQYPNFYGSVEDLKEVKEIIKDTKALFIVVANPLALAKLEAPGNLGADIVVGDMQPLGINMQFGGPHAGFITTTKKLMRKIPGRMVGQTVDQNGERGFVMALQTREQHIRREKATSNYSSNQALFALMSTVFMTAVGKEGIQEYAKQNISKSHYLAQKLQASGFEIFNKAAFFNEFVVKMNKSVEEINDRLFEQGYIGGYDISEFTGEDNHVLICVTEKRSKEEIDEFANILAEVAK